LSAEQYIVYLLLDIGPIVGVNPVK
jgi:hypothetical protein